MIIVIVEQWPCPPGSTLHVTYHSGLQVSKKQNGFFPLTCKDLILWGTSVTERQRARPQTARARISNPVSGGQCHIIHLTILRTFSRPICAQRWPKTPFISLHVIQMRNKELFCSLRYACLPRMCVSILRACYVRKRARQYVRELGVLGFKLYDIDNEY